MYRSIVLVGDSKSDLSRRSIYKYLQMLRKRLLAKRLGKSLSLPTYSTLMRQSSALLRCTEGGCTMLSKVSRR